MDNNNSPVFEMILESLQNEPYHIAKATPASLPLEDKWQEPQQEGQLAVDVAVTENELLVISTMAGAEADKIEVYIHNDLLTIRGERRFPLSLSLVKEHFHQECFWGRFSRTIVLPQEVKVERAEAEYKNGVLIIRVPKRQVDAKIPVLVLDE